MDIEVKHLNHFNKIINRKDLDKHKIILNFSPSKDDIKSINFSNVKNIQFNYNKLKDELPLALSENNNLESISFIKCNITPDGLSYILMCQNLTELNLPDNDCINEMTSELIANNIMLKTLNLHRTFIYPPPYIDNILKSKTITNLDLSSNEIKTEKLKNIKNNTTLKILNLENCHIGANGVEMVLNNRSINDLNIGSTMINYNNIVYNSNSERALNEEELLNNITLTCLNISGNHISKDKLIKIAQHTTLTDVDISDNSITDEVLKAFLHNPNIKNLKARNGNATEECLKSIIENRSLHTLDLCNNKIYDFELYKVLLTECFNLYELHLNGTRVNDYKNDDYQDNLEREIRELKRIAMKREMVMSIPAINELEKYISADIVKYIIVKYCDENFIFSV